MAGSDTEGAALPLSPTEALLATTIARQFYLDSRPKVEIAKQLGISRFKVARLLEAALAQGIVEIRITIPAEIDATLSQALGQRFGLHHAIVVRASTNDPMGPEPVTDWLGPVAAQLVERLVEVDDVLGLAWGHAVSSMSEAFTRLPVCTVVQLTGTHPHDVISDESVEAVRRTAALSGGAAFPVYAPLVVPDAHTAEILRCQPGTAEALDQFHRVTKAVVAIGAWAPTLSTVYDSLSEGARERYARLGVHAEMSGLLFDRSGRGIVTELDDRVISVKAGQLSGIPEVIGVAGGIRKAEAIGAVLRSGLLTGIVTDASAARHILSTASPEQPPPVRRTTAAPSGSASSEG